MYPCKVCRYDLWEVCALLEEQLRTRQDTLPSASQNHCLLLQEQVHTMWVSLSTKEGVCHAYEPYKMHKVNLN